MEREARPWSKKCSEDREWDAIVIGSGMGGMTTAALLAKLGKRVLVLEQHYVPGGFTHAFRRKGFEWDVGVHLIGEASPTALPGKLMHALAPGLRWESVGPIYDEFHYPDDFHITFSDNPEEFVASLKAAFPHEASAIDIYLQEARLTTKAMQRYFMGQLLPGWLVRAFGSSIYQDAERYLATTTEEVVNRIFKDEKLRTVICGQWGYYGAPPSQSAWALQAVVSRHFLKGGYYPVGGAASIAKAFLSTVADAGGWTRICADVDQIVVAKGRAMGVRLRNGEVIRAKRVVSAAGAWNTATKLLPPEVRDQAWARRMGRHRAGPAHVSLYVGFEGDIASAGGTRQCQWFYDTWSHEQATWEVHPDKKVERPKLLFTSYPSLKDPEHQPGEQLRHTGEMITFVPWEAFERWQGTDWRKRGQDYEAFKAEMSEAMFEVLFERYPGLKKMVVHHELSTPLSTDKFARPHYGSIYGLLPTPERYANPWLRPKTPVAGLYQSGCDVATCGVVGAMGGGILAAMAMEPVRSLRYLRPIVQS